MNKIVFFNTTDEDKNFFENKLFGKFQLYFFNKSLNTYNKLPQEILDSNIISCFTISQLNKENLEKFKNLEAIILRCVGFNNIDIEYCKEKNIKVLNAKGYGNRTVAEYTLGLILDSAKNISKSFIDINKNNKEKVEYEGFELIGKTLGIIGVGAIGSELVKLTRGFDMNILGFDLYENEELKNKYNLKYTDLDTLLKNSDFISIHTPLTKETYHLINDNKINLMKKNSTLINTSRGEIIDTIALYKALFNKKIKGAALDVLECEEATIDFNFIDMDYLDKNDIKQILLNHEITKLDNIIITPHIAYDTKEAKERIRNITVDNINSYFLGEIKNNVY